MKVMNFERLYVYVLNEDISARITTEKVDADTN